MTDYISREALLDVLDECIEKCEKMLPITPAQAHEMQGEINATKAIRVFVKRFDAADVRSAVKSKWADNWVSFYRGCPECGAFVRANLDEVFLRDSPSAVGKLNFCPNCGAWMEES